MDRTPSQLDWWWDFKHPEMSIHIQCNHPALPYDIATVSSIKVAEEALEKLVALDVHPRMKPERILARALAAIQETPTDD